MLSNLINQEIGIFHSTWVSQMVLKSLLYHNTSYLVSFSLMTLNGIKTPTIYAQKLEGDCGSWVLRRLLQHNFNQWQLFDVYQKEVRSILEMGVPVWHSSLTKVLSNKIENIQKLAFKLILKDKYQNYKNACKLLSTDTLKNRRTAICTKFALGNLKSGNSLFQEVDPQVHPTRRKRKVVEYRCNTNRFYRSSLPYLSRLINSV